MHSMAARASEWMGAHISSAKLDTAIITHSWKYLIRKLQVAPYSAIKLYSLL